MGSVSCCKFLAATRINKPNSMDSEQNSDISEALPPWFHELAQPTKTDVMQIIVPGLDAYRSSKNDDIRLLQERKLIADIKANSDLDATRAELLVNVLVVNERAKLTPLQRGLPAGPGAMSRETSDALSHTVRSQGFQQIMPPTVTSKILTQPSPSTPSNHLDELNKSPPATRPDPVEVSPLTSTPQHLLASNATLRLTDTFFELIFDQGGILPNRKARRRAKCKLWMCGSVKQQDGKITLTPKKCSVVMHGVEQGLERTFAGQLGGLGPALGGNMGGMHGNLAAEEPLPNSPQFKGTTESKKEVSRRSVSMASNLSTMTLTAHWFAAEGFFLNSSEDENQKWLSESLQALPPDALDVLWKFLPESTFKREEVKETTFTLTPLSHPSPPGFEISGVDLQAIAASTYDAANATLKFSSFLNAQPFFNSAHVNKTELLDELFSSNARSGTADTLPDMTRHQTSNTTSTAAPSLRSPDDFAMSSLSQTPLSSRRHLSHMENSSPEPILLSAQSKHRTKTHRSRSEGVLKAPRPGPTLQTIPSEESLKARKSSEDVTGNNHLVVHYGAHPRRHSQPTRTSGPIVPQLYSMDSTPNTSLVLPADPTGDPTDPKEIRVVDSSELGQKDGEKKEKDRRPLTAQLRSQSLHTTNTPRAIPSTFSALAADAPPWFNQFPYELQDKCMDLIGDLQNNRREPASVVTELEKLGIAKERATELIQHVCLPPRLLHIHSDGIHPEFFHHRIGVQRMAQVERKDRPETCRGTSGSLPLKTSVSGPALSHPPAADQRLVSQWTEDTDPEDDLPSKLENLECSPRHVYHWASSNLQVPKREDSMAFSERPPAFDPASHTMEEIISKFEERVVEDVLDCLSSEKNQCRISSEEQQYTVPMTIGEQAQLHIERERNRRKLKRQEERIKRMVMHLRHEAQGTSLTFGSFPSHSAMSESRRGRVTSGQVQLQVPNILAMPSFSDTEGGSISPFDMGGGGSSRGGSDAGLEATQIDNRLSPQTNSSLTRLNVLQHTSQNPGPTNFSMLSRLSRRFDGDG